MNNFLTLFNYNYLPQGLALINSLKKKIKCKIWVICLDEKIYNFLKEINLQNIELIKLSEIEKKMKISNSKNRKFHEYCWLLTPISIKYILEKFNNLDSITYVDADVYFFKKLDEILIEFELSGKDIFIQEHGFHKKYKEKIKNGKFCVQFLTFKNNFSAKLILNEWLNMCVDSTSIDYKKGIIGDQKYFDDLYMKYSNNFCISKKLSYFQAPWTLNRFKTSDVGMYHFHSLRVNKSGVKLYSGYDLNKEIIQNIYLPYLSEIKKIVLKYELNINQTLTGDKENSLSALKKFIKEKIFKFYSNKFNYFLPFEDIK